MRAHVASNLALIYRFEKGPDGGYAAVRYPDPGGRQTIGWGHLLSGPSDPLWNATLTAEMADNLAIADLAARATQPLWGTLGADVVNSLSDNQWGAIVDFTFNAGIGNFAKSTMCRYIENGLLTGVPGEFGKWIYGTVDGKLIVLEGLKIRRNAEKELWLTP